jgi:hypothetical protein
MGPRCRPKGNQVARVVHLRNAREFRDGICPVIRELRRTKTLTQAAAEMNDRGFRTRRGRQWNAANVWAALQPLDDA